MRLASLLAAAALFHTTTSLAATCEATFDKKGNPVTGLKYTAVHSLAELTAPDAINQLRGIVLGRGYDVLAVEAEAGSMLMELPQSESRRSFQIIAGATREGSATTLQLRANLRAGMFVKDEFVREEMCALLAELRDGQAGIEAAARGKAATAGGGPPTPMTAQALAQRVSNESAKNPDEIPLRYQGRAFTLTGYVDSIRKDGETWHVAFEITDPSQMALRLPGQSDLKTEIVCLLAPGLSVYALTLKRRAKVTLTGTFDSYRDVPSPAVMWLSGCKPETR